ncbi:putative The fantastic four family protein [Medicago truncatula]|uniref:DUF3049 family protein n=1 Tax=Medicago truncatula TaxID=3880 RepID=A0A072UYM9_MEDTR|nr:DUF3049 family protein [Medicago truncatula]RHN68578.1 putative The fantastic four family protein [Medicago truncatula]
MDTLNEYLSSKAEKIATSLYNYTLRARRSCNNNGYYCYNPYHGLKTIVHSEEEENLHKRVLHCYKVCKTETAPSQDSETCSLLWQRLSKSLWSSSPGSTAIPSTVMGDLIGTESGDYMSCDLIDELLGLGQSQSQRREFKVKKKREKKVFPAAITLLRETGGGGGMSSCFKKEYGEDGRLILKVGKVKRYYEHMEANRENGRLIVKLIHHDDDDGWPMDDDEEEEDEEEEETGFDFEFENEREGLENESGPCWADLRQCASYGSGGLVRDFEPFYLGRYGSAPLLPITSVM